MADPDRKPSTFERHPARWIIGLLVFWLCATPLSIILSVWIGKHYLERSGLLGDTFGVVNSLFSGLALLGAIYAIILQQRQTAMQQDAIRLQQADIEKGEEQQERQLKIAQDTARLQTLSYFARLQLDAMKGATPEMHKYMQVIASFYGERTKEMMQTMGEDFASISDIIPPIGIIQMNCRMGALSLLSHIADELESFNDTNTLMVQSSGNNAEASKHIIVRAHKIEDWIRDYASLFGQSQMGYINVIPPQMRIVAGRHADVANTMEWKAWVNQQAAFPRQIREARKQIEEDSKFNNKPMF